MIENIEVNLNAISNGTPSRFVGNQRSASTFLRRFFGYFSTLRGEVALTPQNFFGKVTGRNL